jgi:hypothetical protein
MRVSFAISYPFHLEENRVFDVEEAERERDHDMTIDTGGPREKSQ